VRVPSVEEHGQAVREIVRREGFMSFIEIFWAIIEAGPLIKSWHIEAIAEVLQAVDQGQIKKLVINQPPSTSKSTLVSVMWPAYCWTLDPTLWWITTGFGAGLVLRDAERMLQIVQSPLYRAAWPEVEITKRRPPVSLIQTTAKGRRYSVQLGGEMTGWHATRAILDDPIKPSEAAAITGTALAETNALISQTLSSRLLEGPRSALVCIMQRLAAGDPSDLLLNQGADHLMLPMRYVPGAYWDRGCRLGKLDPRTEPGELLCPDRYDEQAVQALEIGLETPQAVASQHQQNPTPQSGAFFEAGWFKWYSDLPERVHYVQSWDLGFKGKRGGRNARASHSRVHGALWAYTSNQEYYLVDEVIGTLNYPETKREFQEVQSRAGWNRAEAILVEDKANGSALIDELRSECPLIKAIEPDGSKEDRAARHSAVFEAGRVWVPNRPWAEEFKTELINFPKQAHNDRVDTTSQAFDYMRDKTRRYAAALHGLADAMKAW